jgi:hypothetical protein
MKLNNKGIYIGNKHDEIIEKKISQLFKRYKISSEEVLNNFPIYVRRQNLKRFISHLEIFKKTIKIPGDIAEFGVFRGCSLMTWANLLETYSIGSRTKRVFGFDNWRGFESFHKKDGKKITSLAKKLKNYSPKKYLDELKEAIKIYDDDRFVKWKSRIILVEGSIEKTLKNFLKLNPGIKFNLVHFDMDLYKPTKIALKLIWNRVSKGGIIIFDEYSIQNWPGETMAVDEFLKNKKEHLECFSWTNTPGAFLVKNS